MSVAKRLITIVTIGLASIVLASSIIRQDKEKWYIGQAEILERLKGLSHLSNMATKIALLLSSLFGLSNPTLAHLDIVAETSLDCGAGSNDLTTGYLDLDTGSMFFTLFHAKEGARDKGLVIQFGGGPGATSWDYALLGASPCQLKKGGNGTLEPSPYPWTDHANLLLLDYPIGAGWSCNNPDQIAPNTSQTAAYDFDAFLQALLTDYPEYIDQPLIVSSVSYGGFLAAYLSETVTQRNEEDTSGTRIIKKIDQILLGNPFGDVGADLRWRYNATCVDQPAIYDVETCSIVDYAFPKPQAVCQDSLLWADTEKKIEARTRAYEDCVNPAGFTDVAIANPYNRWQPVCNDLAGTCFWWYEGLSTFLDSDSTKSLLNVRNPDTRFWYVNSSALNFYNTHDNMQISAFKHYERALNAGTRLLVMSGDADTVCPWQGSYSWMSRLNNPNIAEFRQSPWRPFAENVPAKGEVINPGSDFTLLRVFNGSHFVSEQNPELVQKIVAAGVAGFNYDPTNPQV